MEFLGHEEEGWYSGQLKGQTGVFPFNYVEELSSPGTVSSAPTTDGKQLSSVTVSKIRSDKPLIPISKGGGAVTPNHDDPTPPSAGEMECLPQCMMRIFILYLHLLMSVGCLLGGGREAQLFFTLDACNFTQVSGSQHLLWSHPPQTHPLTSALTHTPHWKTSTSLLSVKLLQTGSKWPPSSVWSSL